MRALTLHEKITLKGLLARKFCGFSFPRLDMGEAIAHWRAAYGTSIADYPKYL